MAPTGAAATAAAVAARTVCQVPAAHRAMPMVAAESRGGGAGVQQPMGGRGRHVYQRRVQESGLEGSRVVVALVGCSAELTVLLWEAQTLEVIVLVHGLILRETCPAREAAREFCPFKGVARGVRERPVVQATGVVRVHAVVAPDETGLRRKQVRIRVLVHRQNGDGVAVGIHARPGGEGGHLTRPVNLTRVVYGQDHPLLPAMQDRVPQVHTHRTGRSFLLLWERKQNDLRVDFTSSK